jgi:hypothetical protein
MSTGLSPRGRARIAGAFYALSFISGVAAFALGDRPPLGDAVNLLASATYVVVTVLFYSIFKPVNQPLSLLAAGFSLLGCALGVMRQFHFDPLHVNNLAFFGCYCLLIGYLIIRSTFLPSWLGVLMMIGGLGWLTFAWPALSRRLAPFNMLPGVIAEGVLTVWLLVVGLNAQRWEEQAHGVARSAAIEPASPPRG